jgi:hypothetical protein
MATDHCRWRAYAIGPRAAQNIRAAPVNWRTNAPRPAQLERKAAQ